MKKSYISLWLLLAVSFSLFFLFSSLDNQPSIFGHRLKSSKMAETILCDHDVSEAESDTLSQSAFNEPAPAFPVATDTATQTLLFIGDSMLDGLSPRLAAYASSSGHTLYSVVWYSSTSEAWGKSKRLQEYINRVNPTFIFICLGSNELMVRDIKEKRKPFVNEIVNEIGDIPFLWIGPPNWKKDTGINDLIRESVPEGSYFKSDGMHFDRRKDGAHPTAASAIVWLDSVVRWMPDHSNHPIRLEMPQKKTDRPKRVFVHQPSEI